MTENVGTNPEPVTAGLQLRRVKRVTGPIRACIGAANVWLQTAGGSLDRLIGQIPFMRSSCSSYTFLRRRPVRCCGMIAQSGCRISNVMLTLLLKLIDRLIDLSKRHEEVNRAMFVDFVPPAFQSMLRASRGNA